MKRVIKEAVSGIVLIASFILMILFARMETDSGYYGIFVLISATAICIPRQIPKKGTRRSRAYRIPPSASVSMHSFLIQRPDGEWSVRKTNGQWLAS